MAPYKVITIAALTELEQILHFSQDLVFFLNLNAFFIIPRTRKCLNFIPRKFSVNFNRLFFLTLEKS